MSTHDNQIRMHLLDGPSNDVHRRAFLDAQRPFLAAEIIGAQEASQLVYRVLPFGGFVFRTVSTRNAQLPFTYGYKGVKQRCTRKTNQS